jgi:YD repeat-containing protein
VSFGRVKTKQSPGQDENTAITYDYNLDDSIQKVTDARGASQTLTYNARQLVTGIGYSAPSGIPASAPVSYGYDATGNRISMTDGLGSMSYQYDQLSRMSSETRTITGVGTYPIGYTHNLAGELKSVTDPFGSVINYDFDKLGPLTHRASSTAVAFLKELQLGNSPL